MKIPDWYPNELSYVGDEHIDADYVSGYDRKANTDPTDDLSLLRELGLNQTHTLVDLGAGTGSFALAAAPSCNRVIAVDISPVMLDMLRKKAAQLGVENIQFVQSGFLSYEHQGELADFVYSRHALHHLSDFWKAIALQRLAAILKPRGVLYLRDLIFSCALNETHRVIENWLDNASEDASSGWTRSELQTHLRTEYSTFSWLLEPMLERAGFEIQHREHDPSGIYSIYTCIKR